MLHCIGRTRSAAGWRASRWPAAVGSRSRPAQASQAAPSPGFHWKRAESSRFYSLGAAMIRTWKCVLAGGKHHGESLDREATAASSFPAPITMSDGVYAPMTMTTTTRNGVRKTGTCVMAHSQASLEQVNEAHAILLQHPVDETC